MNVIILLGDDQTTHEQASKIMKEALMMFAVEQQRKETNEIYYGNDVSAEHYNKRAKLARQLSESIQSET